MSSLLEELVAFPHQMLALYKISILVEAMLHLTKITQAITKAQIFQAQIGNNKIKEAVWM